MTVLLLGGTAEAAELADRLAGLPVVTSLAGMTRDPRRPEGDLRVGGFGGAAGLAAWAREHGVRAVVDATHPFAEQISAQAVTGLAGVPLLRLQRPGWVERPGDRWQRVPTVAAAAALVGARRALVTTGRRTLSAFAACPDVLSRSVEAPAEAHGATVLLSRGPFTVEGERELLREHRIEVVVSKDSGGEATRAKLDAARELGLPVVLVDRPPAVPIAASVPTVAEAEAWVRAQLG